MQENKGKCLLPAGAGWRVQDEFWGYITNCGTEGNLHGILVGRENLPDGGWVHRSQGLRAARPAGGGAL